MSYHNDKFVIDRKDFDKLHQGLLAAEKGIQEAGSARLHPAIDMQGNCIACGQHHPAQMYGLGALPLPKEGEEDVKDRDDGPCQHCGADLDTSDNDLFFAFDEAGFPRGDLQIKIAKLKKKFRFVRKGDNG